MLPVKMLSRIQMEASQEEDHLGGVSHSHGGTQK